MQTGRKSRIAGPTLALALAIVAVLLLLRAAVVHADLVDRVLAWPLPEILAGFLVCWAAALTWMFVRRWSATARERSRLEEIVFSISPDTLVVIDSNRRIVGANGSLERVFGYQPTEVIGSTTDLLYSDRRNDPARPAEIREALERE